MSEPTQTCRTCGATEIVQQSGRGFPPDVAKQKLAKRCRQAGHVADPEYRAGVQFSAISGQTTWEGASS